MTHHQPEQAAVSTAPEPDNALPLIAGFLANAAMFPVAALLAMACATLIYERPLVV